VAYPRSRCPPVSPILLRFALHRRMLWVLHLKANGEGIQRDRAALRAHPALRQAPDLMLANPLWWEHYVHKREGKRHADNSNNKRCGHIFRDDLPSRRSAF
jgi:hypothetical protein